MVLHRILSRAHAAEITICRCHCNMRFALAGAPACGHFYITLYGSPVAVGWCSAAESPGTRIVSFLVDDHYDPDWRGGDEDEHAFGASPESVRY